MTAIVPTLEAGKILYLENLTVSFDGFKALNKLTCTSTRELRCIIGPNGAGKTTMMDVITGKTRPDAGTAWFGARWICWRSANRKSRKSASGVIPETDGLRISHRRREPRARARRPEVLLEDAHRALVLPAVGPD
jgi:ATPase subunit of ABC transporter with duplicated ATPase domains